MAVATYMNAPKVKQPTAIKQQQQDDQALASAPKAGAGGTYGQGGGSGSTGAGDAGRINQLQAQGQMGVGRQQTALSGPRATNTNINPVRTNAPLTQFAGAQQQQRGMASGQQRPPFDSPTSGAQGGQWGQSGATPTNTLGQTRQYAPPTGMQQQLSQQQQASQAYSNQPAPAAGGVFGQAGGQQGPTGGNSGTTYPNFPTAPQMPGAPQMPPYPQMPGMPSAQPQPGTPPYPQMPSFPVGQSGGGANNLSWPTAPNFSGHRLAGGSSPDVSGLGWASPYTPGQVGGGMSMQAAQQRQTPIGNPNLFAMAGMGQPAENRMSTQSAGVSGLSGTQRGLSSDPLPSGAPTATNPGSTPYRGQAPQYQGNGAGMTRNDQYSTQPVSPTGPQPGNWTPPTFNQPSQPQGTPASHGGGNSNFWKEGIYNPSNYTVDDTPMARYISEVLPVAQFDQNNYQYTQDFNEAQRRWNQEFGATQGQNQFQQGLSTRQQQMAEWQAQEAASQWGAQFGHTQNMDYAGLDLSQQGLNIQGMEATNTGAYQKGLIGNQAFANDTGRIDVTGRLANDSYANQANAAFQKGTLANNAFANDTDRFTAQGTLANNAYNAQTGRMETQGTLYNNAFANDTNRYNVEGTLANNAYNAQTDRLGVQNQFALGQGQNANELFGLQNTAAYQQGQLGNERFGLQNQAAYQQGQLGNERFGLQNQAQFQQGQLANQGREITNTAAFQQGQLQNTGFANQTERQLGMGALGNQAFQNQSQAQYWQGQNQNQAQANNIEQMYKGGLLTNEQRNLALQELVQSQNNQFLYAQMQQQAQQAQLERENMLAIANTQAYGRSAAPRASWARSWS